MKLSDQAMGAIMMALQKSLLEQSDIVPVLKNMKFQQMDNGQLMVENPPSFSADGKSSGIKTTETDKSTFLYESGTNHNA